MNLSLAFLDPDPAREADGALARSLSHTFKKKPLSAGLVAVRFSSVRARLEMGVRLPLVLSYVATSQTTVSLEARLLGF